MKLTPWFDGSIHKPKRRGVYMQRGGGLGRNALGYQLWDGKAWGPWFARAKDAATKTRSGDYAFVIFQDDDWRGVLK